MLQPQEAEELVRRKHPATAAHLLARMAEGTGDFRRLVHEPLMDPELNRAEVQAVVAEGLRRSHWSYKRALGVFGIATTSSSWTSSATTG